MRQTTLGLSAIANKSTLLIYSCTHYCTLTEHCHPGVNTELPSLFLDWIQPIVTLLFSLAGTVIVIPQECYSTAEPEVHET